MTFYELVVHDHLADILHAHKDRKLTTEMAIAKIKKTAQYLYTHERYTTRQKEQTDWADTEADES